MTVTLRCTRCGRESPHGRQVEAIDREKWTCTQCADKEISLDLLDFIQQRIKVKGAEYENHGRFVLRELVQNADDAGATIVALRFERDALYVANDGRAFTTTDSDNRLSDFAAISAILKRTKAEDKEMTGHFGSGFQTVYALSNAPEVHSSGRSGRMNPVEKEWAYFDEGHPGRLVSPYVWRRDDKSRGVLFRFPWRDDIAADAEYGKGKRPFSNPDDWPRWDAKQIRGMYEDLLEYVHPLLLCCNRLRVIRLIWVVEGRPEAFQAERDFTMERGSSELFIGEVREGSTDFGQEWFSWSRKSDESATSRWRCFQAEGWKWKGKGKKSGYLIQSGTVTDDKGSALYVGRRPDGRVDISYYETELRKQLKRNDIHLLLPLFDTQEVFRGDGRAFLYSAIPLPKQGGNRFVFSGHFFPTEDRMDVSVTSLGGKDGEWHQRIVLSVGRLYRDIFPVFVQKIQELSGPSASEKQKMILNALPGVALHEWMRPGKDTTVSHWADPRFSEIMVAILRLPILHSDGRWAQPAQAYWPKLSDGGIDETGARLIKMVGHVPFTEEFVGHPHFTSTLVRRLTGRQIDAPTFLALFNSFLKSNGGRLVYGATNKAGVSLDKEDVASLIRYCITREGAWIETKGLPVVPGGDGVLRPLTEYKIAPAEFAGLRSLFPPSMVIHDDFEELLAQTEREARTVRPDDVVQIISRVAAEDPHRFESIGNKDHEVISRLMVALARNPDFKLKGVHVGLRFIPYRYRGNILLGSPNFETSQDGRRTVFEGRAEDYGREFIFAPSESGVPGLSEEIRNHIRLLDLTGCGRDDWEAVARMLHLVRLQQGSVPTNFVRHFLSDRHASLFRDEVLKAFLESDDKSLLNQQKRAFLETLAVYYDPDDLSMIPGTDKYGKREDDLKPSQIGQVPCLYDVVGDWARPVDFAVEMTAELEVLGYKTLHPDLEGWDSKTLEALGVERRPQAARIIEQVQALMTDTRRNRATLAGIAALILTSDRPWYDGLRELDNVAWIVARNGLLHTAREVLIPSPENTELLGEYFPYLFDLTACSSAFMKRIEERSAGLRSDRARELGIALEPSLTMLMEHMSRLAQKAEKPPTGLFRRISERIGREATTVTRPGSYYFDGKWWKGDRIFLSEDENLKSAMGDDYLFLRRSDVQAEETYLRHIGAEETVEPAILLHRLAELSQPLSHGRHSHNELIAVLWDRLELVPRAIEKTLTERFSNLVAYPVPDGYISPSRIVLVGDADQQTFPEVGRHGDWYSLPEVRSRHARALKVLGARSLEQLSAPEIRSIIESLSQTDRPMSQTIANTVVHLLLRSSGLAASSDLANAPLWPAKDNRGYSLRRLDECYVRDHPAAAHFENDLVFLYDPPDWKLRQDFRRMALSQGGNSRLLSHSMIETFSSSATHVPDEGLAARLRLTAGALAADFPEAYTAAPYGIDWLKRASVFRVEGLQIRLEVGGVHREVDSPCMIVREDVDAKILRVGYDPALRDSLTTVIVQEIERRGFPIDTSGGTPQKGSHVNRSDLENVVYRLLTRDVSEWHLFIRDLHQIDEWVPPLLDEEPEARQGYVETRQRLLELYGRCQICGRRTPTAEGAFEACEMVRSIVSMRGGRYPGRFDTYTLGNSLFLCPSHHALYVRKLVKIIDLERARDRKEEGVRLLREMAKRVNAPDIQVEVYEMTASDGHPEPGWKSRTLTLTPQHAREMLTWFAEWLERERW